MAVSAFESVVVAFPLLGYSEFHRSCVGSIGYVVLSVSSLVGVKPRFLIVFFIIIKVLEFLLRELLIINLNYLINIINKVIKFIFFIQFSLYFLFKFIKEKGY